MLAAACASAGYHVTRVDVGNFLNRELRVTLYDHACVLRRNVTRCVTITCPKPRSPLARRSVWSRVQYTIYMSSFSLRETFPFGKIEGNVVAPACCGLAKIINNIDAHSG